MRTILVVMAMIWGTGAAAHPGHIELLAGHDHWAAGAAIGLAILLGLAGAMKGKRKSDDDAETEVEEEEVAA